MTEAIAGSGEEFVVCLNGRANPAVPYGPEQSAILNDDALAVARRVITAWSGYAATPLVPLPGLAKKAGVGALFLKDESGRFGLGSFKALGGAYAVWRVLCDEAAKQGIGPEERERFAAVAAKITVCCATDGNFDGRRRRRWIPARDTARRGLARAGHLYRRRDRPRALQAPRWGERRHRLGAKDMAPPHGTVSANRSAVARIELL